MLPSDPHRDANDAELCIAEPEGDGPSGTLRAAVDVAVAKLSDGSISLSATRRSGR